MKGIITTTNSIGREEVELEVCGLHLGAYKRKVNLDVKRAEESAEESAERDKINNASKASMDWAEKLRVEFGLPVEGLPANRDAKIRCEISPEQAYKVLDEVRSLLDEVYQEHPFRKGEVRI